MIHSTVLFTLVSALLGGPTPNQPVPPVVPDLPDHLSMPRVAGPSFERSRRASRSFPFAPPSRPQGEMSGADLIIGDDSPDESLTITGPFSFEGTILVLNQGRLLFDDADARIRGSIIVVDEGRVDVRGGAVRFLSSYLYQHASAFYDRGQLTVRNAIFEYLGGTYSFYFTDDAQVSFRSVVSNARVTAALDGHASVTLRSVEKAGEFVILGANRTIFNRTTGLILWLQFGAGTIADLSLPDGEQVPWFRFPGFPPGPTDPPWRVELRICEDVLFTVMTEAGCDLTLRDSQVRALGMIFEDAFELQGLVNGQQYDDWEAPLSDRRIALVNTGLQTWNAYAFPGASGTVQNSIMGEILVMGGESTIDNTLLDGSGGYFGSVGGGTAWLLRTGILSPITVREESVLVLGHCGTPSGEIRVDSGGVLAAVQTPLRVRPPVTDTGLSAVGWLDAPIDPRPDSIVELSGTAVIDGGPGWPIDLVRYEIEFSPGAQPVVWFPVANGFQEVWSGPLASWNTTGLLPGDYWLRMTLHDNLGNLVELLEFVQLEP